MVTKNNKNTESKKKDNMWFLFDLVLLLVPTETIKQFQFVSTVLQD